MPNEHEIALGKYQVLKKEIKELAVKAQALNNDIYQETETFLSEKDFTKIDYKKVITLSRELIVLQEQFKEKIERFSQLRKTFNIED